MKNTKVKIISTAVAILLATLLFCVNSFAAVKINFPQKITGGKGKITVTDNTSNDKIYYQAVPMTESQYNIIGQLEDQITATYRSYKEEFDPKNEIYQPLSTKVNNGTATEAEYQQALQLKHELEALTQNYESTKSSLEQRRDENFPQYDNSKWIEAVDGNFEVTNTTNEEAYYALWAKVGDVTDKMPVRVSKSQTPTSFLTLLRIEEGKAVELNSVIGPSSSAVVWTSSDPTVAIIEGNKIKGLKVGETSIAGMLDGQEVGVIRVTVTESTTPGTKLDIPDDAKEYKGHSYYYFSGSKTWEDAKAYCEKIGGHLVTITTQGESDFIKTLKVTNKAWIGAYKESNWKWVTDENWSFTNWSANEPGSKDKGAVVPEKWATYENDSMEIPGFICEWDTVKSGSSTPSNPSNPSDPSNKETPEKPNTPTTQGEKESGEEQKTETIYSQGGSKGSTNPSSVSGDTTIAKKEIPQTGESIAAILAISAVAGMAIVSFANYRKNKI